MTSRTVEEWIGKTPDTKIPQRVRLRVFERFGGVCQLTNRKIQPGDDWEIDHRIALANGGEHREGNLQPVLKQAHRRKTAQDVAQKAKDARVRAKHLGLHQSKTPLPGGRNHPLKRKVGGRTVRRADDEADTWRRVGTILPDFGETDD